MNKPNVQGASGKNTFKRLDHSSVRPTRCGNRVKLRDYRLSLKLNVEDAFACRRTTNLSKVQQDAIVFRFGLNCLDKHGTEAVADVWLPFERLPGARADDEVFQIETGVG